MPKFLDAPSWYDNDGELREIVGHYSVGANNGSFQIPALSENSYSPFGSTIYVSTTYPDSGQVCVSSSGRLTMTSGGATGNVLIKAANGAPQWLSNGTSGQVLKSNGSAAPSWTNLSDLITITPLYCHKGYYWRQTPFCRVVYTYYSNSDIKASSVSDLVNGLRLIGATSAFSRLSCTGNCTESSGGNRYSIQGIHVSSTVTQFTISYYTDTEEKTIDITSGTVEERVNKIN